MNPASSITTLEHLPTTTRQQWKTLQLKLLEDNFLLLLTEANWYGHLEEGKYEAILKNKKQPALTTIFNPSFTPNQNHWRSLRDAMNSRGFFVPVAALNKFSMAQILEHLDYLRAYEQLIDLPRLLQLTKAAASEADYKNLPLPYLFSWEHFQQFALFLTQQKQIKPYLLQYRYRAGDFEHFLPGQQVIVYLHLLALDFFGLGDRGIKIKRLVEVAQPIVQSFMEDYDTTLFDFFETIKNKKRVPNKISATTDIKQAYSKICQTDFPLITFQELVDNQSDKKLGEALPEAAFQLLNNGEENTGSRIKNILGQKSIIARLQSVREKDNSENWPVFIPDTPAWTDKKQVQWHQWSPEKRQKILGAITYMKPESQLALNDTVNKRRALYLSAATHQFTSPFINWELKNNQLIPVLPVLPSTETQRLREAFFQTQGEETKANHRLAALTKKISALSTEVAVVEMAKKEAPFTQTALQEKWQLIVKSHLISIANKISFDVHKMRQYGILQGEELPDEKKNIWLQEMLRIEEEVKPYVLFVKNSFRTALPIRRTVRFDPYRHSMDGVEFDPETFGDQFKWQSGEVMRTLRHETARGYAEQLNAFALDSSGSMEHEKMRNLFKILYLLVLGLEDRKSHDAFHFFGTYFIETVNISDTYTNRSVLYTIIRNISKIKDTDVIYGGRGGTNISEGILRCHKEVITLKNKLQAIQPELNLLCSIFVITDGEPSIGVINTDDLSGMIENLRQEGDIAIKGIFVKPESIEEDGAFMEPVFGDGNFVETDDFEKAIHELVLLMSRTYKQQRKEMKGRMG